jgi:acyl CoA:acetate/3-ketoacid CoA transferase
MEFRPKISPDLKRMDETIFLPKWGRLQETLENKRFEGQLELAAAN